MLRRAALAALMYSSVLNDAHSDQLRLYALPDADSVTRLAIAQQITENTPLGRVHRFRFYGSDGFFPEVRLSGKRIAFAEHVLQRFTERVPNAVGADITNLLMAFYGNNLIGLPVGPGRVFIMAYRDSILAFTYKESEDEYYLTTCLTVNKMSSLREESPMRAYNFHYGEAYTEPADCPEPTGDMQEYIEIWRRRTPFASDPGQGRAEKRPADPLVRAGPAHPGHRPDRGFRSRLGNRVHGFYTGPRLMEAYPLEPFPEGEKLRARFVDIVRKWRPSSPSARPMNARRSANGDWRRLCSLCCLVVQSGRFVISFTPAVSGIR